ncbi:MAG: hypothetical protein AABX19_01785 [Nanoarchaeota archaeon]
MIDVNNVLKEKLHLGVLSKASNPKSVSIAFSSSGKHYISGKIESFSHLLNIGPENGALSLAVQNNDFGVNKIVTMTESLEHVDPLVLKIIADHSLKTGNNIEYEVVDINGNNIFKTSNTLSEFSFYKPNISKLQKTFNFTLDNNHVKLENFNENDIPKILKDFAIKGITKNFPNYDSASGYGAAILTKNNNLYFSGQYSSPDNRLGIHAEMSAVLAAIMSNDLDVLYVGIVYSKFKDSNCPVCGSCRQFLVEHSSRTKIPIKIFSFAKDTDNFKFYDIKDYLPDNFEL